MRWVKVKRGATIDRNCTSNFFIWIKHDGKIASLTSGAKKGQNVY